MKDRQASDTHRSGICHPSPAAATTARPRPVGRRSAFSKPPFSAFTKWPRQGKVCDKFKAVVAELDRAANSAPTMKQASVSSRTIAAVYEIPLLVVSMDASCRAGQLPCATDQLCNGSAASNSGAAIAPVPQGVFISHWSARRRPAVHPASAIRHRRRLATAPAACSRSASWPGA